MKRYSKFIFRTPSDEADVGAEAEEIPELESESSAIPSDRVLNEIRNKTVKRGQFGIFNILCSMTLISVVFAAPSIFGLDTQIYWLNVASFAWVFLPGWIYLCWWAADTYDLGLGFQVPAVLAAVAIACLQVYLYGPWVFLVVILWVPLIPSILWVHLLFRGKVKSREYVYEPRAVARAIESK